MTLPLAGVQVALTRPADQALALTQAICASGGEVLAFPLLDIVPLHDHTAFKQAVFPLSRFDWVVFISSNAVQHGMPLLLAAGIPAHLHFAAIGPVTAQALQQYGIQNVLIPEQRYDSESLLALPEMLHMQGKQVLIVRGVGGREVLAETLKQRGAEVTFGECYRRINPQSSLLPLQQAQAAGKLQAIVVTSSEALRALMTLSIAAQWPISVPVLVNHPRIAEQAAEHGVTAYVAAAPGDAGMLNLIQSVLGHASASMRGSL